MTYKEAEQKIRQIDKATKYIKAHISTQFYYDNTTWINLLRKLKIDKANIEELIYNEELEKYEEIPQEIDEDAAKFWGIKVIKL